VLYLLVLLSMYKLQRSLMYHPNDTIPALQEYGLSQNTKAVYIQSHDGLGLLSWYLPPRGPDKPLIVFFHGNAGHIGDRADRLRMFRDLGYGFLIASYRYNAQAGGQPGEEALLRDGQNVINWLINKGHNTKEMIFYGESLGSGIAVSLAQNNVTRGIILESPYSSITDVAADHYWYLPVKYLLKDRFESYKYIGNLISPVLILHGAKDKTIPLKFAQKLYESADSSNSDIVIYPEGEHVGLYEFGALKEVTKFINNNPPLTGM
ncbi:alpha/beta hydrolase, partial [Curvivirga aplysinae]|uniref:alpha/beta hydrolase n=1 Tax=Curvivirga aplysinae TaxID=2529852 RepID=UPI0012BB96EA